MPMFVKKHNEAFLEFGLGIVSSFNIGQNQINSILRRQVFFAGCRLQFHFFNFQFFPPVPSENQQVFFAG